MSTTATIAIGFTGTMLFLVLAWVVWQRGRAAGRSEASSQLSHENDEATQFIPPPEPDGTIRLPPPSRDETGTVAIPAPSRAEGTVAIPVTPRAEKTALVAPPPVEEPTIAIPPPGSRDETAMLVRRSAPASTKPAAAPTPKTEVISTEEILAVIAKHRPPEPVVADAPVPSALTNAPAVFPPPEPLPPPTPKAAPPSIAAETLQQHFDAALAAMTSMFATEGSRDLPTLAQGPELEWRRNIEVLALVAERSMSEFALPTLLDNDAMPDRRSAAASVLLELENAKGHERFLEHFSELDAAGRELAITALARWGSDRVEAVASKGYRAAGDSARKLPWLRLFAARALDPGPIVAELLSSDDPVLLAEGLRLLPLHERGRELATKIDRHVVTGPPAVRMAAIRAGLVFERPSAWIACKTASRDPAFPEACSLVAMLAPQAEVDSLASWASKPSAPAHAGWALGLSGRVAGLAGCIERMGHDDPRVLAEGLAGFRHATGYPGADTQSAIREWWAANESRFARDKRCLGGETFSMGSIRSALATAPRASRDALRLELQVRSGGKLRLPTVAMPSRELAALSALDAATIDLNRCWGK